MKIFRLVPQAFGHTACERNDIMTRLLLNFEDTLLCKAGILAHFLCRFLWNNAKLRPRLSCQKLDFKPLCILLIEAP